MTTRFPGAVFWAFLLAMPVDAGVGVWSTSGPVGAGAVWALAVDPMTPGTVYAGGDASAVFKSNDGGETWKTSDLWLYRLDCCDHYPFGCTCPHGPWITSLAVDPAASEVIYVGTSYSGVLRSTDGGTTWSSCGKNLAYAPVPCYMCVDMIQFIAVTPSDPEVLYAAPAHNVLYRSQKDCESGWTALPIGGNPGIAAIVVDPSAPQTVYAGGHELYKTIDGGNTWHVIRGATSALAIDPTNPSIVYAGKGWVEKSINGGLDWTPGLVGWLGGELLALVVDATRPNIVYAGTNGQGIYRSEDGGGSWTALNAGLTSLVVHALAISRSSPVRVFAATDVGVFWYEDPPPRPRRHLRPR